MSRAAGKRPQRYDVIEISSDDDIPARPQLHQHKRQRKAGTMEQPISLSDSEIGEPQRNTTNGAFEPQQNMVQNQDMNDAFSDPVDYVCDSGDNNHPTVRSAVRDAFGIVQSSEPHAEDNCLQRVLELYPDIAHDHVITLHRESGGSIQTVIEKLLKGEFYPKEKDKKRPTQAGQDEDTGADDSKRYQAQDRAAAAGRTKNAM